MNLTDVHDEYDMLIGELNRMFVTDDAEELDRMHKFALHRLYRLYEYHYNRLVRELNNE